MAEVGNQFDLLLLGDEDGDQDSAVHKIVKKLEEEEEAKKKEAQEKKDAAEKSAAASAKPSGDLVGDDGVPYADLEGPQRESRNYHSGVERGRGRGGRGRGRGRSGYGGYDVEQYDNGSRNIGYRRNYNEDSNGAAYDGAPRGRGIRGRGRGGGGGGGRGRGRGPERVQYEGEEREPVNEVNSGDRKQVEDAGWEDIPQSHQRGYGPRDDRVIADNGDRNYDGDRREGPRSYNVDRRNGYQKYAGERGDGPRRYRGGRRDGFQYNNGDRKDGDQTYGGERVENQYSDGDKRGEYPTYGGERQAYEGGRVYRPRRNGVNRALEQSDAEPTEAYNGDSKEGGSDNNNVLELPKADDTPDKQKSSAEDTEMPAEAPVDGKGQEKPKEPAQEDAAAKDADENEEEKYMTLEEYEKLLSEKRKALEALKAEERKVTVDKELEAMQLVEKKKEEDIFVQLKSEKGKLKKKDSLDKEEKARKVVSITEFLKPAEGEEFAYRRFNGRPRSFDRGDEVISRRGGGRGQDSQQNGDRRSRDYVPRNGSGRDQESFPQNGGGGRRQYTAQRNVVGRDLPPADLPDGDNSRQGDHPLGRGGRGGGGGGYRSSNTYSRPRGGFTRAPDVEDPGQFPALVGGATAAKA